MTNTIWWLRRDLRLFDNLALHTALKEADAQGGKVIPLFIIDPALWRGKRLSTSRSAFLAANLASLDKDLQNLDSYLVIRTGKPAHVLAKLSAEQQVHKIIAQEDFTPYAIKRDAAIAHELPLELVGGGMLHHPAVLVKADGEPYKVFTPFSKRWLSLPMPSYADLLPIPDHIPTPAHIASEPIMTLHYNPLRTGFLPGEKVARKRLSMFAADSPSPIYQYDEVRDHPNINGTSQISPYLHLGILSFKEAVASAQSAIHQAQGKQERAGAEKWLNELIWREFYNTILYHFPYALKRAFKPAYRDIPWVNDPEDFEAWKSGNTGYPLIDAAMRQLITTGWMHNRARMITASFLVKNLLVNWQWGESWFMQNLLDGNLAANNGGWQWVAGTGTDAAPYFRVFNPVTQSKKFDPEGTYIRRWVPELKDVPDKYLHTPWKMDAAMQKEAGCQIGLDYPAPIIDLKFSRERVLDVYKRSTSTEGIR